MGEGVGGERGGRLLAAGEEIEKERVRRGRKWGGGGRGGEPQGEM